MDNLISSYELYFSSIFTTPHHKSKPGNSEEVKDLVMGTKNTSNANVNLKAFPKFRDNHSVKLQV